MLQNSVRVPLVSVVIPCLNRAHYLVPTLESVLQQDYPAVECVVVDGGSTDGTLDILRRYDSRIAWISGSDQGPPDAINKGWGMGHGEILAWLNADDLWAPGAVSTAVAHLQAHPQIDVVYGDCGIIDHEGTHLATARARDWDLEYAVKYCDHIIYQPASFMRWAILERVGWLYPRLCHDHELWLRIGLAGGRFERIPVLLAYARHHTQNLGYRSDLVIPLKLDLTRKFFERPGVPHRLQRFRRRAISNAYLRGIDYVFWENLHWRGNAMRSLALLRKAVGADPTNVLRASKYLLRLARRIVLTFIRFCIPGWLWPMLRAAKRSVSVKALRTGG